MTDNMNLTTALTIIADEMADHLRINTLIISGHRGLAITLIDERTQSMIRSYAEEGGRACGPDEFLAALEFANNSFGPLVILTSRLVAIKVVEERQAMFARLN